MKKILIILAAMSFVACSSDKKADPAATAGAALGTVNGALGSIAALAGSSFSAFAGVPNANCSATGSPQVGGVDMVTGDPGYMGAVGYCQTTFNTVSPDSVRGAMHIASGMMCEAAALGLFEAPGTADNQTFAITAGCWGTADEAAALAAEMGPSIPGVSVTVTDISAITDYNFNISLSIPAFNMDVSFNLLNSGNIIAGLNLSDGWAFSFNTSTGALLYESIDVGNSRRNRIMVQGTLDSNNEYTAITNISGFQEQSGSLYTYSGTLNGLIGDLYNGDSTVNDRTNECYAPSGVADCSTATALTPNDTGSLRDNDIADRTALISATSPISFTVVDPTDTSVVD